MAGGGPVNLKEIKKEAMKYNRPGQAGPIRIISEIHEGVSRLSHRDSHCLAGMGFHIRYPHDASFISWRESLTG